MNPDITTIWAFIIAFAVFMYVVMDGFDLGIGILFPTFARGEERAQAMNAIAPVWDGNETWLVLGGGGLFAAFAAADLIDLWIVTVIPVMLGGGVPLLPAGGDSYEGLELVESRTLPGGCVQLHYRPRP